MRGDRVRVNAEQFISIDYGITLLTISAEDGMYFCPSIWSTSRTWRLSGKLAAVAMSEEVFATAQDMVAKVVKAFARCDSGTDDQARKLAAYAAKKL